MKNIYQELLEKLSTNHYAAVITQFKGRAGKQSADFKRTLIEVGEDSAMQEQIEKVLHSGSPQVTEDQDTTTLIEPFYPKERLIIFGGGHIALPLVEFGAKIGFSVIVVDDRPDFANQKRFPFASEVLCESFERCFDRLNITEQDYLVIVTRGHRYDTVCLRNIMQRNESIYVGMIGSKRRVIAVKELLKEEGFDAQRVERVCTPIGLAIGAVTPEEIAISIIAQIISRKRLDSVDKEKFQMVNRSDLDFDVLKLLADETSEAKSIVTVLSSQGSVPRQAGAKMVVYPTGQIAGSIGGGCSEAAVIRNALDIIGSGEYMVQTVDMSGDIAEAEGMACGGTMKVLIEDASPL